MNEEKERREYVSLYKYTRIFHEACYDRDLCREAGADYNRMNEEDMLKIRQYLNQHYVVRE